MAPQSLDLGLSLGLGVAAFQPSFCHPAGNDAAEREASPTADERERRCSPAGSPTSSGSGKRVAAERSAGSGSGDEDDDGGARKKLRLSKDQAAVLEECFKTHHTLTPKQKAALASRLGLRARQVEVWFQNRRARTKLKQTEVDCEYLRRWCEQLAEENRRLGKEVAELRALSAAPAPAAPLTALTMCLSCRRVSSSSCSSSPPNTHAHAAAAGTGRSVAAAAATTLPAHRQFLCGFRDGGAAAAAVYGTSSALAKALRAAR
ncbi:Homeobox-leucine zipper protein HOX28 [Zea mays]|uniref:Homeobox-leucine zipper protein HOX28 n=2 Tax=Zea mays TaxID=4577 RepID=A0A3L6ECI9_MAIZE